MQRFRSEAVTLARLNHPRIAAIHELTRDEHDLLMVMEYVAGTTCEKLVGGTGALPVPYALALIDQVLDALEHAHKAGVVHRDLKPSNLMVAPSGDVKVMDFGIARIAGSEHLTNDGYMMGTPAYMAPEQVRGAEVDGRADLYAAAVVLYRVLTNRLPFRADTPITIIQSHLMEQPTPLRQLRPDLPDWLDAVLARGLAKPVEERFQAAAEFRLALQHGVSATVATMPMPAFDRTTSEMLAAPTPAGSRPPPSRAIAIPAATTPVFTAPHTATPAMPTPTAARGETTVTLRIPHLAVAGALLALLVIGVALLAYAALRGPAPIIVTAPSPAAPVAAAAPPSQTSAPPISPAPVAAVPAVAEAAPKPAPAPSVPALVPASAAAAAGPSVRPRGAATPAPATTGSTAAADSVGRRGAGPPPPPDAPAPTESFGDVKAVLPLANEPKGRDVDALLSLEPGKLVVRSRESGVVLKTMAYKSIAAATYVQAKRPKGSDAPTVAAVPGNFGGTGFFLGSSRHWLTLQSKSDFLILRLDDKNVRRIMTSLESRTGVKTQRPQS